MKTFSVLTVSKRLGWEGTARLSIQRQTIQPDKWVAVREHNVPIDQLSSLYNGIDTNTIQAPPSKRPCNLNASLNEGLRHITADYVIFYQDFIKLEDDCFEKLLELADERTFVTTCTSNYDGSNDRRYTAADRARPCAPHEWESNVAIAPMSVIRALGGFDEEYDNGWAYDNRNLAERAAMMGCRFIIDESNRPQLLPHEQTSKLELEENATRHAETMQKIQDGILPLRCNYL